MAGSHVLRVGDRHYTLEFSFDAAARLQKRRRRTFLRVLQRAVLLDAGAVADVLWVFLRRHHATEFPDSPKGFTALYALIDAAGGPMLVMSALAPATNGVNER